MGITSSAILRGEVDNNILRQLRDIYLVRGQYTENLEYPEGIENFFNLKIEQIQKELFPKEYAIFMDFIRTVALNV
jgi:hypothetical protein